MNKQRGVNKCIFSFLWGVLLFVLPVLSVDNGLGLTPQMGWNSWNSFWCGVNETIVQQAAQQIVALGLADVGYTYVNVDDCWAGWRNAQDNVTFPSGMASLAKYVHGLGLKFGLYSDSGNKTCAGRPGSWGYEKQDAESYASWGVDYLKFDNCFIPEFPPDEVRYADMEIALQATGREIFFSLCTGEIITSIWGPSVGNSWRTTNDIPSPSLYSCLYITATWHSWSTNIQQNNIAWKQAGPGGWNDPDMLEVGNGLPYHEEVAHFSLWALAKAPLIIGCDLTTITNQTLEVIAINQDPLGIQGRQVAVYPVIGELNDSGASTNLILEPCNDEWQSQSFTYTTDKRFITWDGRCVGAYSPSWFCGFFQGSAAMALPCFPSCKNLFSWNMTGDGQLENMAYEGWCVNINTNGTGPYLELGPTCSGGPEQTFTYDEETHRLSQGNLCLTVSSGAEVWAAPMSDRSVAVVLFNKAEIIQNVPVAWEQIWLEPNQTATVRDLWKHKNLGTFTQSFNTTIRPHSAVMLRIYPVNETETVDL